VEIGYQNGRMGSGKGRNGNLEKSTKWKLSKTNAIKKINVSETGFNMN